MYFRNHDILAISVGNTWPDRQTEYPAFGWHIATYNRWSWHRAISRHMTKLRCIFWLFVCPISICFRGRRWKMPRAAVKREYNCSNWLAIKWLLPEATECTWSLFGLVWHMGNTTWLELVKIWESVAFCGCPPKWMPTLKLEFSEGDYKWKLKFVSISIGKISYLFCIIKLQ